MGEIVLAKLINGIIIIGNKTDNGDISEAYAVQMMPDEQQRQMAIMIMPMMAPLSDESVFIENKNILCTSTASKDLSDKYLETKSGLTITNKMPNTHPNLGLVKK